MVCKNIKSKVPKQSSPPKNYPKEFTYIKSHPQILNLFLVNLWS